MVPLPFFIVPLSHSTWEEALAYAQALPDDSLPELRLDHFPELDPEALVDALNRRCLVACRRQSEGGAWPDGDEGGRLERLRLAAEGRPAWIEWEWDQPIPAWLGAHRIHTRILRAARVTPGVFDLQARLESLPDGEAFLWVGHPATLADNARLKQPLAWARDHNVWMCAFLLGPRGIPSQCLQAAWGGRFTYAAPGDGPPGEVEPLPLSRVRGWRLPRQQRDLGLGGVLGTSALDSPAPTFHNETFQLQWKNLLYLPLECGSASEAVEAIEALNLVAVNLMPPLNLSVPEGLGLRGPLDTLWRRSPDGPWQGANTGEEAISEAMESLTPGPVLLLEPESIVQPAGAPFTLAGREVLVASRSSIPTAEDVAAIAPVGVLQLKALPGVEDPLFRALLEAAHPSLRWALDWTRMETSPIAAWVLEAGLELIGGQHLIELQARAQSRRFVRECG